MDKEEQPRKKGLEKKINWRALVLKGTQKTETEIEN